MIKIKSSQQQENKMQIKQLGDGHQIRNDLKLGIV